MYQLAKTDELDFNNQSQIFEIIANIGYNSDSQEEITKNLTILRNAAVKCGKKSEFAEMLKRSREIIQKDADFADKGFSLTFKYNFEDFASSEEPYWEAFNQPTAFLQKGAIERLASEACKVGFKTYKAMYKAFIADLRQVNKCPAGSLSLHPTDFPNQPIELESGEWNCDVEGVSRTTTNGKDVACFHPIMPIERLVNIDTGEEKLKIAYSKGKYWREIIVGKKELFDATKVIQLAAVGVSVTSKTAKYLSEFLCNIETLNYETIPETESVSRLGYIGDGLRFSPYVDDITFDGDANYSNIFKAISQHGSYENWLDMALKCRRYHITAQIMLAASFASVLISKIGGLNFFVHLWGIDSGTGKTVAMMLAASIWGDPEIGKYPQTFNATQVGHEKTAAFLNNIPMCIDELQLSKDSHGHSKFDVYQLSQGVGRTRGNKGGGIDRTPTWSLCILTTGESPITSESSGAGAVNRVIDIECRAADKVIEDGFATAAIIKKNYGFAGKMFVESLIPEVIDEAKEIYQRNFKELSSGSTTEKQAASASMILTADELADRFIFKTGKHLTTSEISEFLKSKASVSTGERGYAYMCDWVGLNANKFKQDNENTDVYGIIDGDWAYINNSVFRKSAKDAGFDDRALLSWLKTNNLIQTRGRSNTRGKRINGINVECVVMKLHVETTIDDFEELI